MSATLYDDAVITKIKSWIGDERIHTINSNNLDEIIGVIADENGDKALMLPLIFISRDGYELRQTNRSDLTSWGLTLQASPENVMWANAIPISLRWRVDIITRYKTEAEEIVREVLFNCINFPKITVDLPYYEQGLKHYSTLKLDPNIEDNSSQQLSFVKGQFTRLTLNMECTDAYLFDIKIGATKHIIPEVITGDEYVNEKFEHIERG